MFSLGSISLSRQRFLKKNGPFSSKDWFFGAPLSLIHNKRHWSSAASGVEDCFEGGEITQEELVKRDTPPGASCRDSLAATKLRLRQPLAFDGSSLLVCCPLSGCSGTGVSRRQPGANPAGCDRGAASPVSCGANRFRRARTAAGGVFGARGRRDCDAASPGGSGANLCLRRDSALAVGAAPLRCAPPAAARLRGQREAEAAGRCLDVVDSDFSSLFQPCMSPIDRHRLVSDVVDGRCTLHARLST